MKYELFKQLSAGDMDEEQHLKFDLPLGYISGFEIQIDNGQVTITPGIASIRGQTVFNDNPRQLDNEQYWLARRVPEHYYHIYMGIDGELIVDAIEPAIDPGQYSLYHPEYASRWIGAVYVDKNGQYTNVLTWKRIRAEDLEAGSITAEKLSADALSAISITAENIQSAFLSANEIILGYSGTGNQASPQEGDSRIRQSSNGIYFEVYRSSQWLIQAQFGGPNQEGIPDPNLKGYGLVHPEGDVQFGSNFIYTPGLNLNKTVQRYGDYRYTGNDAFIDEKTEPWSSGLEEGPFGLNSAFDNQPNLEIFLRDDKIADTFGSYWIKRDTGGLEPNLYFRDGRLLEYQYDMSVPLDFYISSALGAGGLTAAGNVRQALCAREDAGNLKWHIYLLLSSPGEVSSVVWKITVESNLGSYSVIYDADYTASSPGIATYDNFYDFVRKDGNARFVLPVIVCNDLATDSDLLQPVQTFDDYENFKNTYGDIMKFAVMDDWRELSTEERPLGFYSPFNLFNTGISEGFGSWTTPVGFIRVLLSNVIDYGFIEYAPQTQGGTYLASNIPEDGQWHHVAFVHRVQSSSYDPDTYHYLYEANYEIYVDGVLDSNTPISLDSDYSTAYGEYFTRMTEFYSIAYFQGDLNNTWVDDFFCGRGNVPASVTEVEQLLSNYIASGIPWNSEYSKDDLVFKAGPSGVIRFLESAVTDKLGVVVGPSGKDGDKGDKGDAGIAVYVQETEPASANNGDIWIEPI
jgi:hypothetical protein